MRVGLLTKIQAYLLREFFTFFFNRTLLAYLLEFPSC